MEQEKKQRESIDDYEEAQSFLKQEEDQDNLDLDRFPPPPTMVASSSSSSSKGLSNRFWISACVNTASTAAIVRKKKSPEINKKIQHFLTTPTPPNLGLHQQTHLPNPLPPPHPSNLRSLPLPHHILTSPPPLAPRPFHSHQTRLLHLAPPGPRHDLQRRPPQCFARLLQHSILPSRSRAVNALRCNFEFCALFTRNSC